MFVVVGKLTALYLANPGAAAPTELVASGGFSSALVGLMDIAFAYVSGWAGRAGCWVGVRVCVLSGCSERALRRAPHSCPGLPTCL